MRGRTHVVLALMASAGLAACAHHALQTPTTAKARPIATEGSRLAVAGGHIWYRVVGSGSATPLLLLHGGPGLSSVYLRSMEALGDERLVIRYDQLGSGKSDFVKDTALFNIHHFTEELDSLRRFLGLERVHLYGHSWGAILALEYYRAHPRHVASLILASGPLSMPAFYERVERVASALPDSLARAMRQAELGQPFDTAAFRAAMREYNRRYMTRRPVAAERDTMMRTRNDAIGEYLNGNSPLQRGTLKDYDARPFLKQLRVPTLFLVGEYDLVDPEAVREQARLTPGARLVVIAESAHQLQWDNPEANNQAVRTFLREVDGRR